MKKTTRRKAARVPHLTSADWRTVRAAVTYMAERMGKCEVTVNPPEVQRLWRVVDKFENAATRKP